LFAISLVLAALFLFLQLRRNAAKEEELKYE